MTRQPRRPARLATLALRNLSRYRKRTIITASAIALGVTMFVGFDSIFQGFFADSDRNYARYETGSAAVVPQGYWEERQEYPLDIAIERPDELLGILDAAGIAAAPRLDFSGQLITRYDPFPEDGSAQVILHGMDTTRDPEVFRLKESIEDGRFPEPGQDEVIIGGWLADRLGAEVGFPVTVTTRTRDGFHQIMDLEIVGIFRTSNPTVDRSSLFLPLGTADRYLEMQGAVTRVAVSLPESAPGRADLTPLGEAVSRHSASDRLEVLSFDRLTEEFAEVVEMTDGFAFLLLALLAAIAIVGISNTMLMAVMEREQEVAMMRAMGFRDREIKGMFAFEAAGIGLLGATGGIVLSLLVVWFFVEHGVDYGPIMGEIELDYRWDGVLRGVWNPGTMFLAALFATIVAGIVSLFPSRRMLKRRVADSMRRSK